MIAAPLWGVALAAVAAQVPAGAVLTLPEAYQIAKDRNPDLAVAQARLSQAHELARKAWSAYLPTVTLDGTYTLNSDEASIALPTGYYIRDMGIPIGPEFDPSQPVSLSNPPGAATNYAMVPSGMTEAIIQKRHGLAGALQLTQALFAPALFPVIRNAYLAEQATALSVENAEMEILFATAQLYYGAVGLQEAIGVQAVHVGLTTKYEVDAKARVGAGAGAEVDYLRAQVERAKAEQDLLRIQNAYRAAVSALAVFLDRAPDFDVVRPAEVAAAAVPAPTREAFDSGQRPDVKAARTAVDMAIVNRRGVKAQYLPNLGMFLRYQMTNAKGFTGEYDSWTAGLNLNWVLWDGGLREAELREATAALVERRASLRATEARARDDLERALLDLASAQANRVKAAEQLRAARETATIVQKSYELGAATYLELLDADAALRSAELSLINETLNADLAMLRVAKARGTFKP